MSTHLQHNDEHKQSVGGFILQRTALDVDGRLCFQFYLSDRGVIKKLRVIGVEAVLFVASKQAERCQRLLKNKLHDCRSLSLRSFSAAPISALYFVSLGDFYQAKQHLIKHRIELFEQEVTPLDRFLMERFIDSDMTCEGAQWSGSEQMFVLDLSSGGRCRSGQHVSWHSLLSLDIETSVLDQRLLSIAMVFVPDHRHDLAEESVFYLADDDSAVSSTSSDAVACQNEGALLRAFVTQLRRYDPDFVIGWNVVGFDFHFLQQKADEVGVELAVGRDGSKLHWQLDRRSSKQRAQIDGRAIIDGIDTLISANFHFDSFSLQYVASEVLGRGKAIAASHDKGLEILRMYQQSLDEFLHYNLEDCRLVRDIFRKKSLIEFVVARSRINGLKVDRGGGSVAAFDHKYLPRLHRVGWVAPNVPTSAEGVGSPGGYVLDSIPGLHQNVLLLDFKSLYPSIMRTFAIDPLALNRGHTDPARANDYSESPNSLAEMVPGFRGAWFHRQSAILPQILEALAQERERAKLQNDDQLSFAIKIVMNSFYGVLGTPGCRFFNPLLVSSITLRAHQLLKRTKDFVEAMGGFEVIYGDTDSIFVKIKTEESLQDGHSLGQAVAQQVNQFWKAELDQRYGVKSYLELEFESYFSEFYMPTIRGSEEGSKKRYAGLAINQAGESSLVIKGLEAVRSDWSVLARSFQRQLFERLFSHEEIKSYIVEIVDRIRRGELDDQIAFPKRIRKPLDAYQRQRPPQIQAALAANALARARGEQEVYGRGSQIHYHLTTQGPQAVEWRQAPIDYEAYIERQILPIVQALESVGVGPFADCFSQQQALF